MDDEDFNMLGGLQRQQNLRQNEATRQEIAALRADLKRKEAAEKAAPKCPYCAGSITNGVVKCRHCTSDIKWCEFEGKSYPIKADENPDAAIAELATIAELAKKRQAQLGAQTKCQLCGRLTPSKVVDKREGLCACCFIDSRPERIQSRSGCLVIACTIPAGFLAYKAIEHFLT